MIQNYPFCKRPSFALQKTAFCKGVYNLLNINRLCLTLKIIPQNGENDDNLQ